MFVCEGSILSEEKVGRGEGGGSEKYLGDNVVEEVLVLTLLKQDDQVPILRNK